MAITCMKAKICYQYLTPLFMPLINWSSILILLTEWMFLLVLSEAPWLRLCASGLWVRWVEERVLLGLECPAGQGQLPGDGLQQVSSLSWTILITQMLTEDDVHHVLP